MHHDYLIITFSHFDLPNIKCCCRFPRSSKIYSFGHYTSKSCTSLFIKRPVMLKLQLICKFSPLILLRGLSHWYFYELYFHHFLTFHRITGSPWQLYRYQWQVTHHVHFLGTTHSLPRLCNTFITSFLALVRSFNDSLYLSWWNITVPLLLLNHFFPLRKKSFHPPINIYQHISLSITGSSNALCPNIDLSMIANSLQSFIFSSSQN